MVDIIKGTPMPFELIEHQLQVNTARFSPFLFQIGVDARQIELLFQRVNDAQRRFRSSPLSSVANQLEREVAVSGVFGTNSIEGGGLSEEETGIALELDPLKVEGVEQQRVVNLKVAYDLSRQMTANPDWRLDLEFICQIHAAVTSKLPHEHNQAGLLRDNPKGIATFVGDTAHGGRYKPPQCGADTLLLLKKLVEWHQELRAKGIPVLIRAPLVHYYDELIHPFWDGNGRVGRVIEAALLQAEGFRYAPFAQARYYFEHVDRYFNLMNVCRKAANKKAEFPNTPFVEFFLEGMLASLDKLHDRVNQLVNILLFENDVKRRQEEREINSRQYAIVSQIMKAGPIPLAELRRAPWYLALYTQRTDKTKQRDLQRLRKSGLVILDKQGKLWPGFVNPGNE
jgi:Fic family protein